jgi:sialate O-acetylesterase
MAVTIDIGDAKNIHPKNKQDVGKRLYLAAKHVVYNRSGVYSGPIYQSMVVKNNEISISFKEVGSGLMSKGEKLTGFAIAGEDKKFYWADAKIVGKKK